LRTPHYFLAVVAAVTPVVAEAGILEIGSGRQFSDLCSAIQAASTGDILRVYGTADIQSPCVWETPGLHIIGFGSSSTIRAANGLLSVETDDVTFENLTFIRTGIEMAGRNLTLRRVRIQGAAVGVRTTDAASGTLNIESSNIYINGTNLQVGALDKFRLTASWIHDATTGDSIVAGAALNEIQNNRFWASTTGSGGADLVLTNERSAVISNNLFRKPAGAAAFPFIQTIAPVAGTASLDILNNTFIGESERGVGFLETVGAAKVTARVQRNIFWGTGAVAPAITVASAENYFGDESIFLDTVDFAINANVRQPGWGATTTRASDFPFEVQETTSKTSAISAASSTGVVSVFLAKSYMAGTGTVGGNYVTIGAPAPSGGLTVALTSNNPLVANPQTPTIVVPAGQTIGYFYVKTYATPTMTNVTITATAGLSSASATISVGPIALSSFTIEQSTMGAGLVTYGNRVSMNGPVPANATVTLTSSNPLLVVPPSVVIAMGTSNTTFTMTAGAITTSTTATITATYGSSSIQTTVTLVPVTVKQVYFAYSSVAGGNMVTAKIILSGAAPSSGLPVSLTSSNTAVYPIAASATIPAGKSEVVVSTLTKHVTVNTPVTITARANGTAASGTITLLPIALSTVTSPTTSASSGDRVSITVRLNGKASSSGFLVYVSSTSSALLPAPASVLIPAGVTSGTFSATIGTCVSTTAVTVTGSAGGVNKSVTLTVVP
jgi:hypothetical protein